MSDPTAAMSKAPPDDKPKASPEAPSRHDVVVVALSFCLMLPASIHIILKFVQFGFEGALRGDHLVEVGAHRGFTSGSQVYLLPLSWSLLSGIELIRMGLQFRKARNFHKSTAQPPT